MPTFNIVITVSPRVASLIRDASKRQNLDASTTARDHFVGEVRRLAVKIAEREYSYQKEEASDPSQETIASEITVT